MSEHADASGSTWPTAVFAISLFQEDLAAAKDFYGRVFGLPAMYEDANSAVFRFGDTMVNLLDVTAAPRAGRAGHDRAGERRSRLVLTVQVDDVDAHCDRLQAAGIALLNGPMDRPWGPRTASFQDPGGHNLGDRPLNASVHRTPAFRPAGSGTRCARRRPATSDPSAAPPARAGRRRPSSRRPARAAPSGAGPAPRAGRSASAGT